MGLHILAAITTKGTEDVGTEAFHIKVVAATIADNTMEAVMTPIDT